MKRIILSTVFIWLCSFAFSQITVSISTQQTSCSGNCNGTATLTPSGGVAPYTYWMAGNFVSSNLTNLCVGQYTVQVTDAVSNYVYILVNITSLPGGVTATTTQTNNTMCLGPYDGIVDIAANNGVPPYTYDWMDSPIGPIHSTSPHLTNIGFGTLSYTVTDAVGCMLTQTFTMPYNQSYSIATTQTNIACNGLCSGAFSFSATGGSGYYIYNLLSHGIGYPGTTIPSSNQYNLCVGGYTLIATDTVTGCRTYADMFLAYIGGSSIPNASITSTSYNESCLSVGNGSIDVSISGLNTGPFTYLWSNGVATQNVSNLISNPYWVTIIDASSNCTTLFDTIKAINSIPNATITSAINNETCYLGGDGFIDVTVSGTNPGPFMYHWSTGTMTQDIYNIASGVYSLTITDSNNHCVVISDTIIAIGNNCGSIAGHVYVDNNGDCSFNTGDGNSLYSAVSIQPGNKIAYTDNLGNFTVGNLSYGTYSVSLVNAGYIYMYPVCGTTLNVSINSSNANSINNDLPVGFSSTTQPDIIAGAFSTFIIPGFAGRIIYSVGNLNNVSASGKLKITFPPNYTSAITTVSPSTYSISGDTIMWSFSNVNYYNTVFPSYYNANYCIEFITPITEPLGSVFTSSVFAQPTVTDLNSANNITYYQRIVTGSYDPNEKTVSPVGISATGDIAPTTTDLTYTIRFQNTGNGPAHNIIVKDTLSPNIDINTFEMLNASHNYNIDILPGNILRWKFNNIMLVDSGTNESASHGYIQYRIKRNNNNTAGTQIKNTAYIYFDFNAPIITNTAINTINNTLSVIENKYDWGCFVYPNPTTGKVKLSLQYIKDIASVTIKISDLLGREVLVQHYQEEIDISQFEKGIYFISIQQGGKTLGVKKIMKE